MHNYKLLPREKRKTDRVYYNLRILKCSPKRPSRSYEERFLLRRGGRKGSTQSLLPTEKNRFENRGCIRRSTLRLLRRTPQPGGREITPWRIPDRLITSLRRGRGRGTTWELTDIGLVRRKSGGGGLMHPPTIGDTFVTD